MMVVTKLIESSAFNTKSKMIPKEMEHDEKIFFKKIFRVKEIAKKSGTKNPKICKTFAWAKV